MLVDRIARSLPWRAPEAKMLHAQQTDTVMIAEAVAPVLVALLTATAAIVAPRLAGRSDDLKRAERLTALLGDLSPSPRRVLLEQLRDDYATLWALQQAAPRFPRLRAASRATYYGGVLVLILGPLTLLLTPGMQWWYWAYYLGGALLLAIGIALHRQRQRRQRRWMEQELKRRGLRPPLDGTLLGLMRPSDQPTPPETDIAPTD
ncbi:hypothetical protein [Microbacterium ureisolvens]|uniref:Uncharacterized protein n=1 Tax=Microbacterium ureisolvens TaxID=2781186 RepID=A0ABS7I2G2_9MICO|nr:hypothetical protein [Microbacterium ureisolvens]MBW9111550.1 hypothetical protein [Microbacterium ureisolvens]